MAPKHCSAVFYCHFLSMCYFTRAFKDLWNLELGFDVVWHFATK